MKRSSILLSGGIDSIALAWWLRPEYAITIDYGQNAAQAEICAAEKICREMGIGHKVIKINIRDLGCGDMSGVGAIHCSPTVDWWPFRNQMLITLAAMYCSSEQINKILIGTVKSDSLHKDGTLDFIDGIHNLVALQEGGIEVSAPASRMTSLELIKISGVSRGILFWAHSCHVSNIPCGKCRGCVKYSDVINGVA